MINIQNSFFSFIKVQNAELESGFFQTMGEGVRDVDESEFKKILQDLNPQPQNTSHEESAESNSPPLEETLHEEPAPAAAEKDEPDNELKDNKELSEVSEDDETDRAASQENAVEEGEEISEEAIDNVNKLSMLEEKLKELFKSLEKWLASLTQDGILPAGLVDGQGNAISNNIINKIRKSLQALIQKMNSVSGQVQFKHLSSQSMVIMKKDDAISLFYQKKEIFQVAMPKMMKKLENLDLQKSQINMKNFLEKVNDLLENDKAFKELFPLIAGKNPGEWKQRFQKIEMSIKKVHIQIKAVKAQVLESDKVLAVNKEMQMFEEMFKPANTLMFKSLVKEAVQQNAAPMENGIKKLMQELAGMEKPEPLSPEALKKIAEKSPLRMVMEMEKASQDMKDTGTRTMKDSPVQMLQAGLKVANKSSDFEMPNNVTPQKFSSMMNRYLEAEQAVMEQVTRNARLFLKPGISRMTIDLNPPQLGKLNMKISVEEDVFTGRIRVENESVKNIIENNIKELKTTLNEIGIKVEKMEVYVRSENSGHQEMQASYENIFHKQSQDGQGAGRHDQSLAESGHVLYEQDEEAAGSSQEFLGFSYANDGTVKVNLVG